jgi:hypothetical protein
MMNLYVPLADGPPVCAVVKRGAAVLKRSSARIEASAMLFIEGNSLVQVEICRETSVKKGDVAGGGIYIGVPDGSQ